MQDVKYYAYSVMDILQDEATESILYFILCTQEHDEALRLIDDYIYYTTGYRDLEQLQRNVR